MLFEVFSERYERTSTLVTSNLPFAEWTGILGSERLTVRYWMTYWAENSKCVPGWSP
jgi:DNA replication protein DnaC